MGRQIAIYIINYKWQFRFAIRLRGFYIIEFLYHAPFGDKSSIPIAGSPCTLSLCWKNKGCVNHKTLHGQLFFYNKQLYFMKGICWYHIGSCKNTNLLNVCVVLRILFKKNHPFTCKKIKITQVPQKPTFFIHTCLDCGFIYSFFRNAKK